MATAIHPFAKLRQAINRSGRQFRKATDNSSSVHRPEQGFTYAYDMDSVEDALRTYEADLAEQTRQRHTSVENTTKLLKEAKILSEEHPDMDVRDFARQVAAHLITGRGDFSVKRYTYDVAEVFQSAPELKVIK